VLLKVDTVPLTSNAWYRVDFLRQDLQMHFGRQFHRGFIQQQFISRGSVGSLRYACYFAGWSASGMTILCDNEVAVAGC
jgi:hypothetical protein